jgi:hypothetical protein
MKTNIRQLTALLALAAMAGAQTLFAQLNVPSDGSDGVLNITSNTVIDLSQAVTGTWSDDNTANSGKGVYDPNKWAVVFKYQSVNIATNATVTFANHPAHAPVVWLVQSNVSVSGTLLLDGQVGSGSYPTYLSPTEPGPGGFRGAATGPLGNGSGFGPTQGYSYTRSIDGNLTGYASYASAYGNPQIMPLIGGEGTSADSGRSGEGGSGAILVVSSGLVSVNGQISANGGNYAFNDYGWTSLQGAGGAIKIIANQVSGQGKLSALPDGRIRVEANNISSTLVINPSTVAIPPGMSPLIWPPASNPTVKVVSVNGQASPSDPVATVLNSSDLNIQTNNPVDILLQTQNFPPNGAVSLRVVPKYANYFSVNATFQSGTFSNATWKATTTLPNGFCVLQAHATSP